MPTKSNRNGRNKDKDGHHSQQYAQQQQQQQQPLSPPTQLPTPLPDESLTSSPAPQHTLRQDDNDSLSRLIDIDYLPAEEAETDFSGAHADFYAAHDLGAYTHDDGEEGEGEVYRSPPFREAQLAESIMGLTLGTLGEREEEGEPLPIPPPRTATATAMPAPVRPVQFRSMEPPESEGYVSPRMDTRALQRSPRMGGRVVSPYAYPSSTSPPVFPPSSSSASPMGFPPQGTRTDSHHQEPWFSRPVSDIPGHVIAPVLQRPSSTLHRVTRSLREYVPSVPISIPTVVPSKPLVSTPLSFGRFTGRGGDEGYASPGGYSSPGGYASPGGYGYQGQGQGQRWEETSAAGRERESGRESVVEKGAGEKRVGEAFEVPLWSHFQRVSDRLLLILGYASGLGIWDCTNLKQVTEILNINDFNALFPSFSSAGAGAMRVVHAEILPPPPGTREDREGEGEGRPFVGILLDSSSELDSSPGHAPGHGPGPSPGQGQGQGHGHGTTFLIYSLRRNAIIKGVPLPGPGRAGGFVCGGEWVVVSTTHPATLHILTSTTFEIVHTIHDSELLPFSHHANSSASNNNNDKKALFIPQSQAQTHTFNNNFKNNVSLPLESASSSAPPTAAPAPVFALKGRFLAFASSAPTRPTTPSSAASSPTFTLPIGQGLTISQADVSNAAWKVGGSMLSGVRALGGMAIDAAKSKLSEGYAPATGGAAGGGGLMSGVGRVFSRSAPAAAGYTPAKDQYASSSAQEEEVGPKKLEPHTFVKPEEGYFVTVLDLRGLVDGASAPRKIAHFKVAKSSRVSLLRFSADGCNLAVVPEHGHDCRIFAIRPRPAWARDEVGKKGEGEEGWRVYTLHRGMSPAAVESAEWTDDARWFALGSNHRTVHLFAVNPYGGPPDVRSHVEGRVRSSEVLQPLGTDVSRAVKIHVPSSSSSSSGAPLKFTFISPDEVTYPSHVPSPTSDPSSTPSRGSQDLLIFDPVPGKLSLYRVAISERVKDQGLLAAGLRTSISLPGAGVLSSSLGSSPSSVGMGKGKGQREGKGGEGAKEMELGCEAHVVAFWHVRRKRDWTEVAYPWSVTPVRTVQKEERRGGEDVNWLAQAELWTHSTSDKVLPRSIYTSHRFTFYTLGEDYHALLRRGYFNIPGTRIEVRKQVEVSAGLSIGENFADFSPAAIENPLASALEAELQYTNPHAVLPMYPNGAGKPRSFSNSIPIRAVAGIGDGVTEGLVRFRRKVRSPQFRARSDGSPSVPLEFEEDDAHFPYYDSLGERAGGSADSAPSIAISTPSTAPREEGLVEMAEDDLDYGWEKEDQAAVDDAERFDDISVVGFLDEEQASMRAAVKMQRRKRK